MLHIFPLSLSHTFPSQTGLDHQWVPLFSSRDNRMERENSHKNKPSTASASGALAGQCTKVVNKKKGKVPVSTFHSQFRLQRFSFLWRKLPIHGQFNGHTAKYTRSDDESSPMTTPSLSKAVKAQCTSGGRKSKTH